MLAAILHLSNVTFVEPEDEGKGDDDRVVEREEGGQRVRAPHRRLALRRDVPLRPRAAVIACGTGLAARG